MNTEDYVSFECARLLCLKGFDWPCERFYPLDLKGKVICGDMKKRIMDWNSTDSSFSAPLQSQALKWLRNEKGVAVNVVAHDGDLYDWEIIVLSNAGDFDLSKMSPATMSESYEDALSEAITNVLEIV